MTKKYEEENAAYATAYWFMGLLLPGLFPAEKLEPAAEVAIRFYAEHKSYKECLSYIATFRLHESKFWQGLKA